MSTPTPFGACVEYLRVSHAELADLLSEGTGKPYSLHRAKMVCDGREPVPGFAWTALRELDRSLDTHRDQLLLLHEQSGAGREHRAARTGKPDCEHGERDAHVGLDAGAHQGHVPGARR